MRPIQLDLPHARMAAGQRCNGERDTLGFYLSGHPSTLARRCARRWSATTSAFLEKIWTSQPSGEKRAGGRK
jgi:DNA polymerase-3 subunit alpha